MKSTAKSAASAAGAAAVDVTSPGKRSRTQALAPTRPRGPIQRKADGAGAVDPEAAVARAAGSTGAPLAPEVRGRFEQSLGADLGHVRVHDGADSHAGAAAVGARAYTVGSDIHFGEGQHRPDDPFGLHLLAHEVAHTQQQAGGAPVRQHQLEVSRPGDAAELDADRAADAMVSGRPYTVGGAASDAIQREPAAGELDFTELREEYERIAIALDSVFAKRAIGVRQVLGNLAESDPPSIGEEICRTLAVGALGLASGYVTTALAAKMTGEASQALNAAIQAGMDDGLKDAAMKIAGKIAEDPSDSKATFFAGQEEALESLRAAAKNRLIDERNAAVRRVKEANPDAIGPVERTPPRQLDDEVAGAKEYCAKLKESDDTARTSQYRASLAKWMIAMAQKETGIEGRDGARLGDEVENMGEDVGHHFGRHGHEAIKGIIYVAIGQKPAARPIHGGDIKVGGITTAALDGIRSATIGELGVPVIVSGYIYDGTLDQLSIATGDNMVSFGKNEDGLVWVDGSDDGKAALKKAAQADSAVDAARVVLDEDIGSQTLRNATVENA